MNLAQIMASALEYLDDPRGRRHTPEVMERHVNNSLADLARTASEVDEGYFGDGIACYSVVPMINSSLEFDLPADFNSIVSVERMCDDGPPIPLTRVNVGSRHELNGVDPRFLPEGMAIGGGFYLRGSKLGVVSPTNSYTLRLLYETGYGVLDDLNDIPSIPLNFHDLLALQTAKRGFGSEGRKMPDDLDDIRRQGMNEFRVYIAERDRSGPEFVNVMEP